MIIQAVDEKNKLIGFARILSDNQFHTVLAEIVVHPDYQGKNIGNKIIKTVKEEYSHTPIYLDALPENKEFFSKQGFIHRKRMKVFSISAK
ncbi:hypothetical protein A2331_01365 [Candidatus Falkowbacteria bacterium RIFOXYB2_FULL_34_18]|uniref:N-acetyltransferase domain-containing protein n=1 Tax=Candidatus Falkowbacteria bacterium RIFOXYD2_FULL_34_120 TaxID=1798007 RepID=A0A1F5TPP8_9BACT|nr:MAG: hypothetical protein A2331_01365 [Candidatus Falkowbacteria bacterium RIFOXYB2_FULL_34_18]OGF29266.1 MAG: hypothetical protein A2500_05245 [Candidatus Falkowbacteria bacterium RIFOXYC12_FULL_34_55]OGF36382.1 MAG: hypothetical protein A2466_00905 [Candidatus Falkowbacteria bacterium RIFOXYC2_FULL_34_220]OGF38861.1 MAG: hypothetical protein A2515_05665 [Candidatus Falkowbacteria bacterium RIFOXYD12_FULL_34_57]OGF40880.1 MAG: hypothetical protein A2531_03890 [Candidatus Falkowbacteria bact